MLHMFEALFSKMYSLIRYTEHASKIVVSLIRNRKDNV